MLSRFDICMARLETGGKAPSPAAGDQNRAGGDQPKAEPVDAAQPPAKKNHAKQRDKKAA